MKLSTVIKSYCKLQQQTSKVPIIRQCYDPQVSQIQPEGFFMSLSLSTTPWKYFKNCLLTRDRQDIIGCGSLLAIENGQIAAINYRLLTVCNGQGKNSCLNEVCT